MKTDPSEGASICEKKLDSAVFSEDKFQLINQRLQMKIIERRSRKRTSAELKNLSIEDVKRKFEVGTQEAIQNSNRGCNHYGSETVKITLNWSPKEIENGCSIHCRIILILSVS